MLRRIGNGRNSYARAGLATKFLLKVSSLIVFRVQITVVFILPQNRGKCMKSIKELHYQVGLLEKVAVVFINFAA